MHMNTEAAIKTTQKQWNPTWLLHCKTEVTWPAEGSSGAVFTASYATYRITIAFLSNRGSVL